MDSEKQYPTREDGSIPISETEARVVACLMEKELTVPDSYPLTLNSLTLACNQKSNREPQMHLSEGEVGHIARDLAGRGMITIEYGERAHKFEHNMRKVLQINRRQQALLTVMMLRAPQTLNDLKQRTRRMAEFADTEEIELTLESLNEHAVPLMQHIPRGAGQREDRYTHLLCGEVDIAQPAAGPAFEPPASPELVAKLEARVTELETRLARLEDQLSDQV